MADPTTSIYLNSLIPSAEDGYENSKFQTDGLEPQQSVTVEHTNNGGVNKQAFDYLIQTSDCGKNIVCTSASPATPVTFTLPSPPSPVGSDGTKWRVFIQNIGPDSLTISRHGLLIDGAATNLTLAQNQGVAIFTDGSNYYTERGLSSGGLITASYPLQVTGTDVELNPLIGFIINAGSIGTDVGPHLRARQAGQVIKCKIDTKASDPSIDLTFKIKQNGVDVFSADPTITHGTASGTLTTSVALTSVPLSVAADDLFTIDITSGSSAWQFTAQLE